MSEPERKPAALTPQQILIPLVLAQFVCSFAGSNMNVAINSIATDIYTDVRGVQTAITMFLLVMAVLMIPGSKLTDKIGRKRCLVGGLIVYGSGAVLSALAPGLGVLIVGYSALEGIGSALLIPPVYILTTLAFTDVTSRARAFGRISGAAGLGAAAGPLIGGFVTTAVSWRASFLLQAAIVVVIIVLSRRIVDPIAPDPSRRFDGLGAVLAALGMFFIVLGILQADSNLAATLLGILIGGAFIAWFFGHIRAMEAAGKEPLLALSLFRVRTSNLALVTQNIQWLMLMGISFVVSVYLQIVRGFTAIQTGLTFTAATVGVLLASLAAERFATRRAQRTLIMVGFVITLVGIALIFALAAIWTTVLALVPGLFLIGVGVGVMLTPSVNVVQSAFPEERQGEISGLSRSVSNLGSSLGTAVAGTILVSDLVAGNRSYGVALLTLAAAGLVGLAAAWMLPRDTPPVAA